MKLVSLYSRNFMSQSVFEPQVVHPVALSTDCAASVPIIIIIIIIICSEDMEKNRPNNFVKMRQ